MKSEYEYSELKGQIRKKVGADYELAKKIGISRNYLSKILNNKAVFNQPLMEKIIAVLQIPNDQIALFFFTKKVHVNETI